VRRVFPSLVRDRTARLSLSYSDSERPQGNHDRLCLFRLGLHLPHIFQLLYLLLLGLAGGRLMAVGALVVRSAREIN